MCGCTSKHRGPCACGCHGKAWEESSADFYETTTTTDKPGK